MPASRLHQNNWFAKLNEAMKTEAVISGGLKNVDELIIADSMSDSYV